MLLIMAIPYAVARAQHKIYKVSCFKDQDAQVAFHKASRQSWLLSLIAECSLLPVHSPFNYN